MHIRRWESWATQKQAIVVLATPHFAKWLENEGGFLPRLLRASTYPVDLVQVELDILVGVVDGIAPTPRGLRQIVGRKVLEGFSIIHGLSAHLLPDLWESESKEAIKSTAQQSSLSFSGSSELSGNITLPLSNTLFTNGKHSTLIASHWRGKNELFRKVKSEDKNHQTVRNIPEGGRHLPDMLIPAVPLTPPRQISSGLGNIIRQLDFGNEGIGPASRELEVVVNAYMESRGQEKLPIAVWALVVPADLININLDVGEPFNLNDNDTQRLLKDPNNQYVGKWIAHGAKFCRVRKFTHITSGSFLSMICSHFLVSGGGGWGAKQGLLSLDPQTIYRNDDVETEPRFDWMTHSPQEAEDQQASALGDIAKPGDYVQFFAANIQKPREPAVFEPEEPADLPKSPDPDYWRRSLVFGTAPSTIDDLPSTPQKRCHEPVILQKGHFGAVSERGMYINLPSRQERGGRDNPVVQSKIDLPYSFSYTDLKSATEETPLIRLHKAL